MIKISIQIYYERLQFKIQRRNPNILHTNSSTMHMQLYIW
jgi:hypothetical protein